MGMMEGHRAADERSIALHAAVAERLIADPRLVDRAIRRIEKMRRDNALHPRYAAAWLDVLGRPLEDLCAALVRDDHEMQALRSCSPFAGVLEPRVRWRILRQTAARRTE
jgi:hypothetical protein